MKKQLSMILGLVIIFLGIIFNYFSIGMNKMFSFASVGNFLVYVGIVSLVIGVLKTVTRKTRKVDERMMAAALQGGRINLVIVLLFAFVVMIIDGISPITIAYSTFISYFIMFIVISNLIVYKLLLKYKY